MVLIEREAISTASRRQLEMVCSRLGYKPEQDDTDADLRLIILTRYRD